MQFFTFGLLAIATVQATQLGQTTTSKLELSNPHSSENDLFKREFKCPCGFCRVFGGCARCCFHCNISCNLPKARQLDQTTTSRRELANRHSSEIDPFKQASQPVQDMIARREA